MSCCGGSKSKTDKWSTFPDAAYNGNVEKMTELLKKEGGSDPKKYIDKKDDQGYTALHRAAQKGQCEAIKFLIEKKADAAAVTENGESALHIACFHRKRDAVAELLKTDAKQHINNTDTKHGMTPLHIAVYRGAEEITHLLLQNGANPNIPDKQGQTALKLAEFWRDQEAAGMSSPQARHLRTFEVIQKSS